MFGMTEARSTWGDLLDALAAVGWTWQDGLRYAPNGTIWFGADAFDPDLHGFRGRMRCRQDRICQFRESCNPRDHVPTDEAREDMESLLAALDRLLDTQ